MSLGCALTDGSPGNKAVVEIHYLHSLAEIMADTPSQMKGKIRKSCSPGDGIVGLFVNPPAGVEIL